VQYGSVAGLTSWLWGEAELNGSRIFHMSISNSFKALLLCGTVLFGVAQAMAQAPVAPPASGAAVDQSGLVQVAASKALRDGTFVGRGFDAYWGIVQVQASIQSGRLVSVDTLKSPNHNRTSKSINRAALPPLQQEAVRTQSARVHIVSGATLTSRAYAASLKDALKQASN
jgi:uncharacterized protein with FMN-binding domain